MMAGPEAQVATLEEEEAGGVALPSGFLPLESAELVGLEPLVSFGSCGDKELL